MKTASKIKETVVETRPVVHKTISCSTDGRKAEIVIKMDGGACVTRHVSRKSRIGDFKWSRFEKVFEAETEVLVEAIEHRELYTLNLKG